MHLVSPDDVAAVLVEPIQGEGGYVVPPAVFHQRLRELTTKHGMLLMVDEVQSGMGRTGKMFAIEHFGVEPDVVTAAKGIASGLPLGVTTARAEVMDWPPGAHASTFGGNPVSCAAAIATIALLRESLVKNAAEVGAHLMAGLAALKDKHPLIGDVRGKGLMVGVELVRDRATKERATTERDRVVDEAFARGMLILGAGRNAVRFSPPLVPEQGAGRYGGPHLRRVPDGGGEGLIGATWVRRRSLTSSARRRPGRLRPPARVAVRGMTDARQALGIDGEDTACRALERRGYRILARALPHPIRRDRPRGPSRRLHRVRGGEDAAGWQVRRSGRRGHGGETATAHRDGQRLPGAPSAGARPGALRRRRHHGGAARAAAGRRVRRRVPARLVRQGF